MANWKEYTTKTTPEDADEIMIADSKANASKRTPFSGLWNWIANKLATAVISQLETQNKSIIPALNELNSKGSQIAAIGINDIDNPPNAIILRTATNPVGLPESLGSNGCIVIQQNPNNAFNCQLAFSFGSDKIAIRRKRNGTAWTDWKYFSAE